MLRACPRGVCLVALLAVGSIARAQEDNGVQEFDGCGVLAPGPGCVLFESDAGVFVLPEVQGDFDFGDEVRAVGTLNPDCVTICPEADGCLSGVETLDPRVFPCGTPLPSFPEDVITGVCASLSLGLFASTAAGLAATRRKRRLEPDRGQD